MERDSELPSTSDQAHALANEKTVNKELSERRLKKLHDAQQRKGVIYISRIPPHMKPQKIRHLLSQYGKLERVYLAPEDKAVRSRRKKHGHDSGKNFTEGWVEFEDKQEAKKVAELLNNNPIGGKRRSAYHYDLWCIKYLPKFKWDHLTEEIAYQNAVREQKLAQEISAANRERDFYLSRVNQAKGLAAQAERKRKRAETAQGREEAVANNTHAGGDAAGGPAPSERLPSLRSYGQRRAKADPVADDDAPLLSTDTMTLLAGRRKGLLP